MWDKSEIDAETMYTILEQEIQNTPAWNHISKFQKYKDGRETFKSFKSHYQGAQYSDNIHTNTLVALKTHDGEVRSQSLI